MQKKVKAAYEHKTDLWDRKKNYRDEDGEVIVGPRNVLTVPLKVGQVGPNTKFNADPWMAEKYDGIRDLARQEHAIHLTKLQDKPFCQRARKT